jgi:hypothetical protein
MKLSEMHSAFLDEMRDLLPDWRFVASARHFKRTIDSVNWFLHVAWVNHVEDFDVIGNVAVEFMEGRKRVVIVGAQLGNIAGVGQTRHGVSCLETTKSAARSLVEEFDRIGLPFLQRFSSPRLILDTLEGGGEEALLISPFRDQHQSQIQALRSMLSRCNP